MQQETYMNIKISLPFRIFAKKTEVLRIVAETSDGSFGILPHRLDCVAALIPGILIYETQSEGEVFLAIDEGVLIKIGQDVLISVRRVIEGTELGNLQEAVKQEFLNMNKQEQIVSTVMEKMESSFIHHLKEFHNE
jgi:F-type H+-transporting ATPase subunit epsilon